MRLRNGLPMEKWICWQGRNVDPLVRSAARAFAHAKSISANRWFQVASAVSAAYRAYRERP
jgi:hypothetical protein